MRLIDFLKQIPEEKLKTDSELEEAYFFLKQVFEEKETIKQEVV